MPRFYPMTEVAISSAGDPAFSLEKQVVLFDGQLLSLALPPE